VSKSTEQLWWQKGVIYQIYPRSFQDSNGDGIGDLPGIIQRLDYLSETLGVDAIWLSPFYPSPMADFGYDISNYTDVHPDFGALADFDRLISEAHARNLKVIVDFVPNHTSDQHPWFLESRSSRDNPRRDWYVWADPKPDGSPPNNWLSVFGGSAWEWDEQTRQFYLHSFLKEQPDLNWRNPEVKEAMFDVVRFWLDRGVDGFRIDVAHYIMKDPDLRDNPPNPEPPDPQRFKLLGDYDSQLHLYDKGHPDVHEVFREFRAILDEYSQTSPRYSVGEIHIFDWQEWAKYYGEHLDELHMPFNFALVGIAWRPELVRQVIESVEKAAPPGGWPNYVLGNHDEPRVASRYGREAARVAGMLLLTLRGTPTLYYGDEIGMVDVNIPPEKQQDPWGLRVPGLGRDPQRTPMQWSAAPNAGFCPPGVIPWLPIADDYADWNVETELAQPASFLNFYRSLLAYRKASRALQRGAYRTVSGAPETCLTYLREDGEQRLLIALNFGDKAEIVRTPLAGVGRVAVSTHMDRAGDTIDLAQFELRGNEGLLVELTPTEQ
jgi:alpha-glucosidase